MPGVVIGVDVSKRWINVSFGGAKARRVEMEDGTLAAFAAQARAFARGRGTSCKTDAVDARALTGMGARLDLVHTVSLPPARPDIGRRLVEARKQELARCDAGNDEIARASLDTHLAWPGAEIVRIEAALRAAIRADRDLAAPTAIRCDPEFAATHARFMAAGKAFKQSVIACAQKLPRRLDAVLKSGQPCTAQDRS